MRYKILIIFILIITSCKNFSDISVQTRSASLSIKNESNDIFGSGFVIKGDYIITNYHVIEPIIESESSIFVSEFNSESKIKVSLEYKDEHYDIAVLKTYAKFNNYLLFDDSELKSGTKVHACGNPTGGAEGSFTTGAISGEKDINGIIYLQHSAPITGGNSGGPLVNEKGELVGVNTFTSLSSVKDPISGKQYQAITRNTTMGFALPANTLKGILESQNLYDDSLTFFEFIESYMIVIIIISLLIIFYIIYLVLQKNNSVKESKKNKTFKKKNLYGKIK